MSFQLIDGHIGQESEAPQIDANDWDLVVVHLISGAQYGPIAPQHNGQIGLLLGQVLLELQVLERDIGDPRDHVLHFGGVLPNMIAVPGAE